MEDERYESSFGWYGLELHFIRFNWKRSSFGIILIFNCPWTFPKVSIILYQPDICCRPDNNGLKSIETKPRTLSPDFSIKQQK